MIKVLSYSGGKDSTAMLITLLKNGSQIDEILYVDMGEWIWEEGEKHLEKVEELFGVEITKLDVSERIKDGFKKYGFPSIFNRWCTAIKRETMEKYLKEKYPNLNKNDIVQYVGYCADEEKRIGRKLYSKFNMEYPLVEAGITKKDALELCYSYGLDWDGLYEHHEHFSCWCCPLQRKSELKWLFNNRPELWDYLRKLQLSTDGYYYNGKTIFDYDKRFWSENIEKLKEERMKNRKGVEDG